MPTNDKLKLIKGCQELRVLSQIPHYINMLLTELSTNIELILIIRILRILGKRPTLYLALKIETKKLSVEFPTLHIVERGFRTASVC